MPDVEEQLTAAETDLARLVGDVLGEIADEFARAVDGADELVAARFSVSRIARMWSRRVSRITRRLLGIAEAGAGQAANAAGTDLPAPWRGLPDRHNQPDRLPPAVAAYLEVTRPLLNAVGERLADAARTALAEGLADGEDTDQLADRLRAVFAADGTQLGESRAERIARTEATRAWNAGALGAARDLTGPDRPLVKQWRTRRDHRVRHAHDRADGQLRLLDEPFTVGGHAMDYPGDPTAPPELTVNCRCIAVVQADTRTSAAVSRPTTFETQAGTRPGVFESQEDAVPGPVTAADDGAPQYTGAMIALVPRDEDAQRLALDVDGTEPAEQLHLTLYYLGDAADWNEDQRNELIAALRSQAEDLDTPITARLFGAAHWNADGDDPCWVWNVGDDRDNDSPTLDAAHWAAIWALEALHGQTIPAQYTPWAPHICAAYSSDPALLTALEERLGPITFDRLRVAFAGDHTDIPLGTAQETNVTASDDTDQPVRWHTPGDTALAFENQQTGDGRVFAPGALYWENGPWPLQHAPEMLSGHQGAQLAGAIEELDRDGDRIPGAGVLYPGSDAGGEAVHLLREGAPLGVSVDLDDVDIAVVVRPEKEDDNSTETNEGEPVLLASLASASVLQHPDGHWTVHATNTVDLAASGVTASHTVQWTIAPDGTVHAPELHAALTAAGIDTAAELTAAAGDPDNNDGEVVHTEQAGDFLMRITRARLRGATLVSMPAFARARIVLADDATASDQPAPGARMQDVITYVSTSPIPVTAADVAKALDITVSQARDHLIRATAAGRLVRLSPGRYVGVSHLPEGEIAASMSGDLDLPLHDDYDAAWDGDAAASRVLDWATSGNEVDADRLSAAFLYRDPDADPATLAAYKLGIADVFDGELRIVVRAVFAVANVLEGGRGGVDIPAGEQDTLRERVAALYDRIADAFDRDITPPWDDEEVDELEASAWQQMQSLPPLPAAWFTEPTAEELPPGSGGVHYRDGRIYGWVAQAGVPHEAFPGKNLTIESLGEIDTTAFLRTRFPLDDGTSVKVGAMTMNVGHHRDGAECETAACQFDDTRTVAGIVTVGMNAGGMWFSGAAAPWLSEWDRMVFAACQPSYHMRQERNGRWSLRAVLSVPVPGHPSRLAASAVIDRANLALAASATPTQPAPPGGTDARSLAAALVTELRDSGLLASVVGQELARQEEARAEARRLAEQLAPARAEVAATYIAQIKGGN